MSQLKVLISRLSPSSRKGLELAARIAVEKMHAEVDIAHYLHGLLTQNDNDLAMILKVEHLSAQDVLMDLDRHLNALSQNAGASPVFSNRLANSLEQGWAIATSLDQSAGAGQFTVRTGHILLALLTDPVQKNVLSAISRSFDAIDVHLLKNDYAKVCKGSVEVPVVAESNTVKNSQESSDSTESTEPSKTPALDQYTFNLTQKARSGKIDPVIGRESEIRQMIDILIRRRQNNPILTGEAGVGKTAVVEGLALKISQGLVPDELKVVEIHVLDMGLLQAGASVKGEFENRLKGVIQEVQGSTKPIILFIDEAHTLIGAGGAAGQNDAANLLKPALARGELRTIAATTWAEYKKYFEKDAALARRFQVVKVEEPSVEVATKMLRAMIPHMAEHFNIKILDEAVQAAAQLSARYISGRQLPDKAIGVLDTAAARVSLSRSAPPRELDKLNAHLHDLTIEIEQLTSELAEHADAVLTQRLDVLDDERIQAESEVAMLTARWQQEQQLLAQVATLKQLPQRSLADQVALDDLLNQLSVIQGQDPLIHEALDALVVRKVIADWTGIPLGNMMADELNTVLTLEHQLAERVIGQDHALTAIAQRVRTARAQLEDPNRPQGVFLFCGPSGVGKTETALALAEMLYGGERNIITINMSEYQEAHTVSSLKGSPPGYVGYGEGGVLTEAVRRRPYSVVLLDEIEKAHADVLEMFFQVFDKGWMEDGEGRYIDFKNTLIILTSNVGSNVIMQQCINKTPEERPDVDTLSEALIPSLYKAFKPAFLGRMKVIPYYPMSDDILESIIVLKIGHVIERIQQNYNVEMTYDESLVELILQRCVEVDTGARNIDHILNGTVLPELAQRLLTEMASNNCIDAIHIGVTDSQAIEYNVLSHTKSNLDGALNANS